MQLPFGDLITNVLGIQSLNFGAKQAELNSASEYGNPVDLENVNCDAFTQNLPSKFSAGSASVAWVRDNLAVLPEDWVGSGVGSSWLNVQSSDNDLVGCFYNLKQANFIAFDESFFNFLGSNPKYEVLHAFSHPESDSVHEAPVYIPETNELVFADTGVIGWLYAVDVTTSEIRKITTTPPLRNVNGATKHGSYMYLATNGGPTPAVYNCTIPTSQAKSTANKIPSTTPENVICTPVVNNYRSAHLNAPNDLIFTSNSHILFTDPNYGWTQLWPGVGPPELSTALYHFNTTSRALRPLINDDVLEPNGLALSKDEKTLYVADSNSTSSRPVRTWDHSVRNVFAYDFDVNVPQLTNKRLVHVVESGWPDGLRVSEGGLLLVASMGGVDVVDVKRGGVLIGKINVGDDIVFNLEPAGRGTGVWLLTGKKGVYKVSIAG